MMVLNLMDVALTFRVTLEAVISLAGVALPVRFQVFQFVWAQTEFEAILGVECNRFAAEAETVFPRARVPPA